MAGKRSQKSLDDVAQLRNVIWLETEADVRNEATIVRDRLHTVREKYRKITHKPTNVKESNRLLIEWNEDLLSFCKANRRKYQMEDRTLNLDRQRLEDQRMIAQYEEEVEKLRKDLKEATEANEQTLDRLSELQSFGNLDKTDLSDPNRPTKLGENCRELYDNEWTDAFEVLTESKGETSCEDEEAFALLYEMLKRCNQLCFEALQDQQKSLAQLVSVPAYFKACDQMIIEKLELPFKQFSKGVATEVLRNISVPDILRAINKGNKIQEDVLQNAEVQKYLEKCFHLCWMMLAQYPPMVMDFGVEAGKEFDVNAFETYTQRGPKIDIVVWPPVYLHKDGPLICKGYAKGTK